ncbi:hypothetical protein ACOJQI_21275 [Bacillus salacetis]|uniref:hypothetical protein n=1 Tax=Bacillus salacetis TaxID=2315464 RepID=UPI003BA1870E
MQTLLISNIILWVVTIALLYTMYKLLKKVQFLSQTINDLAKSEEEKNVIGPPIGSQAKPLGNVKLTKEETLVLFLSTGCHFCKGIINELPKLKEDYSRVLVFIKDDHREVYEEYESKISKVNVECNRVTEKIFNDYVIKGFPFGIIMKDQKIMSKGPAPSLKAIDEFKKAS